MKFIIILLTLHVPPHYVLASDLELIPVENYSDFITLGFDPLQNNTINNQATGFTKLLFADAIAARGNDIFIADTSQRKIFHIDRIQQTLTEFATLRSGGETNMYVASDLSLYVIDRLQRQVIQYSREGRVIRTFGNNSNLSNPIAVYESEDMNRLLIADSISGYVAVFNTLGGMSRTIGQNINMPGVASNIIDIVAKNGNIFLLDQTMHEISVIDTEGNQLYKFGQTILKQPVAIAIDYCRRLFVADRFDNSIHVFLNEDHIATFKNNNSGLNGFEMITDIDIDNDTLFVSDGASAKIKVMKIIGGCL